MNWGEEYSVGVPSIDLQHKRLFDMVNEMHEAMRTARGNEAVGGILKRLVQYTRSHFAYEEKLMRDCGFHELEEHCEQHERLARQADNFLQQFRSGETLLSVEVMLFLKTWLTCHIQGADRGYAEAMREKGVL